MATADELLSTLDTDKTLIIDKDLRIITIPSSVKNLGVESDDDVLRLKFSMPRMYGDVDLSDFSIYINYMNAKNTGDVYIVDDKTITNDTITFSWLVGRVALAYKGNVRFIVCMKKHDDYSNVIQEYNTTIASLPVLEGLETGETVIQQNPDIIEMLLTSSEPLVGTTQTITPSQVLAAIKAGRDIALQYTDSDYGTLVFGSFIASARQGAVVSSSIIPQLDGVTGALLGSVEDEGWSFRATNTATKDDVGTAVNEALAQAKASGEFDGADGLTPTIGQNGNWYLGATDTGKPSRGAAGKSAYAYAQDGGYTGTETEFAAKLAQEKFASPNALTFTGAVEGSYDGSAPVSVEIPSGGGSGSDISLGLTGAAVGQIAKIAAVDDTGKPSAWSPVDMPSGGGGSAETFELIKYIKTTEAVSEIWINADDIGEPFELKEVQIYTKLYIQDDVAAVISFKLHSSINGGTASHDWRFTATIPNIKSNTAAQYPAVCAGHFKPKDYTIDNKKYWVADTWGASAGGLPSMAGAVNRIDFLMSNAYETHVMDAVRCVMININKQQISANSEIWIFGKRGKVT